MPQRHTTRQSAKVADLAAELTSAAVHRLGNGRHEVADVVASIVAYLVEEYPSQDLYIPSERAPRYPLERIKADLRANKSVRSICASHHVGRGTVKRIRDSLSSAQTD